ncbi:DUF1697 domain-containing protein [Variovorax sp. LARHSF232]
MRFAVFYRNVNLGRPNCPSKSQLERAFLEAGASVAASFLVNGTIAFEARNLAAARKVLARASALMAGECGLKEPGFLRELAALRELVESDPFRDVDASSVYGCCVTFLDAKADLSRLPAGLPGGEIEVIRAVGGEVMCVARQLPHKKSAGSPNAFIEKALGLPATTRIWNTVVRLVAKHSGRG